MACWTSALFLAAVSISSARADVDYTYEFTANPGQVTWFNGTTIEIDAASNPYNPPYDQTCSLVSMHMYAEVDMRAWAGGFGYEAAPASLTPSQDLWTRGNGLTDMRIEYANPSGWGGEFDSGWGGTVPFDCPFLEFVVEGSSVALDINSGGVAPEAYIPTSASGTWALVPDAGSSFELLAAALLVLGAGRLVFGKACP